MGEKRKLQKRVFVSEDDMSTLLRRYSAMTVLTLLQEVAQVQECKIDWDELVKKTTTGITNAREYQMLWRHLAYHHGLVDKLDDSAQPMDDDSDVEYELEALPPVSSEASVEAAACVKVLIASGVPCNPNMPNDNSVEASLTINIPNGPTSGTATDNPLNGTSVCGTKITVPVSVQIQPLPPVTATEGLDTKGPTSANCPPRRKRKPWSEAEDMELIAAVQKFGEGNWANISKGDFKGDRTATQLKQRWEKTIRKRHGNTFGNGSQLSEAQLAARHAMSMALGDNFRAAGPNSGGAPNSSSHFAAAVGNASGGPKFEHQQDLLPSKPRVIPKVPSTKPAISPDSMVKAAAVAAGARISTPSGATSLLKAAESKKVIHIMAGGTPAKSPVPGSTTGLPSNVHFIRTGLVSRPAGPSNASPSGTQQLQGHALRPASPAVQPNPAVLTSRTNASSGVRSTPISSPAIVLGVKARAAAIQENQTAVLSNARNEKVEVNRGVSMGNTPQQQVQKDPKTFGSGNLFAEKVEGQTSTLGDTVKDHGGESKVASNNGIGKQGESSNKIENTMIDLAVKNSSVQSHAPDTCKKPFEGS